MSREELRLYLIEWMDSRPEVHKLERLPPSPEVDQLPDNAKANLEYNRANYLRLREQHLKGSAA